MNILYDISVLGIGYHKARARTGIFRVIESLAFELKNSEECNLSLCTSGSSFRLLQAIDYLEFNQELSKVPFIYNNQILKRNIKTYQKYINLGKEVEDSYSKYNKKLLKVLRKTILSASYFNDFCRRYESVPRTYLENYEIYHSPFEEIPRHYQNHKNLKLFLTIYDLIPVLYPKFFEFNERTILDKSLNNLNSDSWITCISHSTKADLCNHLPNLDLAKVKVTHLAASDLFYPCTNTEKLESIRLKYRIPDVPYLLSLSTLEPRKNIGHTIRCFLNLIQQENISDLILVLAGTKGWNYDSIFAEMSHHSSLKDRIILTGFVADEDLAPLYSGALAFIYPSFYEGFGLPPLEAMQCGVPVITSNTSSLPEVVGDAGIMLDPQDIDGLSQSIFDLYQQPSLRKSMSNQSLLQAQKFSWKSCAKQTVAAYKSAMSS